jgi:glycosyltransferase involved in cell wall biosynthesis
VQVLFISRLFKVPLVQRALDVSHEIRKSIYRIPILLIEKFIYKRVKLLSVNNFSMKQYCENLSGRKLPTVINYPPIDFKHFREQERDLDISEKLGINKEDKVITYMGSFFYFSGLPESINRFAKLAQRNHLVKLLLIGGGEQEEELKELVKDLDLTERVKFTGFVAYSDLPKYLSLTDVAINPLKIGKVASTAFPHKVLQYLAMNLTVVSTRLDGLVSALDGLPALIWGNDPNEVMDSAFSNLKRVRSESEKKVLYRELDHLFSPESTTQALERTLMESI